MSLKDRLVEAAGLAKETIMLMNGEEAKKVLPDDTAFAIVAEMFAVDPSEDTVSIFKKNQEYFWGYIAVSPDKLRIYKLHNLVFEEKLSNVTAEFGLHSHAKETGLAYQGNNPDTSQYGVSDTEGVQWSRGLCTIQNTKRKFIVKAINQIAKTEGAYASKVSGMNGGFDSLFNQLEAGGAKVVRPSSQVNAAFWIVGLLVLGAGAVFMYLQGQ